MEPKQMEKEKLIYEMFLKQIVLLNEKYEWIAQQTGEQFNIFSILGMERLECQTHSAFLYELLNPNGSHGQGNSYLRDFAQNVLKLEDFVDDHVQVERERSIGKYGRVDLVIENASQIVIIENKIDAGDQEEQLLRYWEYAMQTGKSYHIFYLTLEGNEPSEKSLGSGKEKIPYTCISYKLELLNWLRGLLGIGRTPALPSVRETIRQYIRLIEKLTQQGGKSMRYELTQLLLKENYLEMAKRITEALPYAKATLEYNFWKRYKETVHMQLIKLGLEVEEQDFSEDQEACIEELVQIRSKKNGDFGFGYKLGKKNKNELILWIGEGGYDPTIYMSIGQYKDDETIDHPNWKKELISSVEAIGFNKNSSSNKYLYIDEKINFDQIESLEVLKDSVLTQQLLERIQKQVVSIVKRLLKDEVIQEYRS